MNLYAWIQLINMLGTFALGVWLYLEKRNDKTNERITDLGKKVDELDRGVSNLEVSTSAAPNHADLGKVYEAMNRQGETLNQLVGENRGQSDTLRLILNQVMQKGLS